MGVVAPGEKIYIYIYKSRKTKMCMGDDHSSLYLFTLPWLIYLQTVSNQTYSIVFLHPSLFSIVPLSFIVT